MFGIESIKHQNLICLPSIEYKYIISQVHIPKRRTLMQILPSRVIPVILCEAKLSASNIIDPNDSLNFGAFENFGFGR